MNKFSSVFLASSDSYIESFLSADNFLTRILKVAGQLVYFACKWIMYFVDVIYFYVLQLAGVNADTSIFDSAKSDTTFRLLIDNKESVTTIIKSFAALAIIMILVTAIIALIKQQASAFKDKKAKKNPAGDMVKTIFKSLLLLIITPLIAILGIVSSSVILQALFNATNLSDTKSLSARVFNASASQANRYYIYAENGVRIPIKYNFSGDNKSKAISYTVNMVGNKNFPSLSLFDENEVYIDTSFTDPVTGDEVSKNSKYNSATSTWLNDIYYEYYDTSDSYSAEIANKYKKFTTHSYEYYAMSDVICYALDTMEPFYFVTIQELLEALVGNIKAGPSSSTEVANLKSTLISYFDSYNVRLLDQNGNSKFGDPDSFSGITDQLVNAIYNKDYAFISYTGKYKTGEYEYVHIKDAVDEMEGAKFVMAYSVDCLPGYARSLNGSYANTDMEADGTFKTSGEFYEVDKFYYKKSSSKYQKVDLYYLYDNDKEQYVKSSTFDSAKTYYYKVGEDYYEITNDDKTKFYYKNKTGEYQALKYGQSFFSVSKNFYYSPLVSGASIDSDKYPVFSSDYINPASLITARGIFDDSGYPTAIRRIASGDIMFYRDDLELVSEGNISDVGTLDQVEAEEDTDDDENLLQKAGSTLKKAWNSVRNFVSALFNPAKLVPDLKLDETKMATTYTNETKCVYKITDGKIHISYFFSDDITSKLTSDMYGMELGCLFNPMNINYIILAIGSITFLKIVFTSVFALINRSLNLFMLILIYPVACSTIPLDEASKTQKSGSYKKWMTSFTGLLFSTYGLILSMNFVFVIIPAIDKIEFFKPEDFINNSALGRLGYVLFNPQSAIGLNIGLRDPNYSLISKFINKLMRIIFEIAAFSLIVSVDGKGETFYSAIRDIVGLGAGVLEDNPLNAVKKTLKSVAEVVTVIAAPQIAIKNRLAKSKEGLKKTAEKFNPNGKSGVINDALQKNNEKKEREAQDKAKDALISALDSGAGKSEIESKLQAYKDAYKIK